MSDKTKIMEGTPEAIYLQTGGGDDPDIHFEQLGEVTWCVDPMERDDTKYIRADVAERELSAARAEAERLREDFAMMIRRLAARLQMRTRGTLHEQADESLVASALDLMRRNGVDLSPLREHRLEQSAIAATRKEEWNG